MGFRWTFWFGKQSCWLSSDVGPTSASCGDRPWTSVWAEGLILILSLPLNFLYVNILLFLLLFFLVLLNFLNYKLVLS